LRQVDYLGVLVFDREDLLVYADGHNAPSRTAPRSAQDRRCENEDRQRKIAQCVSALHDCTVA
jgi:hypothetical protein